MITYIGPDTIKVELDGKSVTMNGELLVDEAGAGYLVYSRSIKGWDPPFDAEPFTDQDKAAVLDMLRTRFAEMNRLFDVS
jgi:hypothetical protein